MIDFTVEKARSCRNFFPALSRKQNGRPVVFFDGPAGTQVPVSVVDAMSEYMLGCNANHGGVFETSVQSDHWLQQAHHAFAEFVGAKNPDEIIFGQNMTSLTFAFSRAISKTWSPGDEIVITKLDHDANISPWVRAAEETGVKVHRVAFNQVDYTLNLEQFQSCLNEKTRLVAVGCASNATGGINPVKQIASWAHDAGALVYLDAVHYGPHGLIDVVDWDCDFLACSAYKFFGPHVGILWGRQSLMDSIEAYRVRPAGNALPGKWMTGTQSHESIVGALACVDYLTEIGEELSGVRTIHRREALQTAFKGIQSYEQSLSEKFIRLVSEIPEIKIYGITDCNKLDQRFPTFSITHEKIASADLARHLAQDGIYAWSGHYYALEFSESLGLEPEGMVRIGLVHYNTPDEIDRLVESLRSVSATY